MKQTATIRVWGLAAVLAWLSSLAFSLDILDPVARTKDQTVEGMALTLLLVAFYHWALVKAPATGRDQRRLIPLAALLGLFTLTGISIQASEDLSFLYSGLVRLAKAGAVWLGYSILLYFGLRALFLGLDRLAAAPRTEARGPAWLKQASGKTILCSMAILLVCWLPYFICLFPGASNTDTWWQLEQVIGVQPLHAGHPLAHTFLQSGLILLGKTLLGSWNAGVFLVVLVQSLFLSAAMGYSVHFLVRLGFRPVAMGALLALYGLVPTFPRAATILMKDTVYTTAVLLFTVFLLEAILLPEQFRRGRAKLWLAALAPMFARLCAPGSVFIGLVKPQFESRHDETDRGVVRDAAVRKRVVDEVRAALAAEGFDVSGVVESPITGPEGNVEYLVRAVYGE